ncbi:YhcH/YjgK/YiaL family protein [Oceanihabitans sp. 2_MG-2023]|uniref:YhcH/YjgK/YiaL family protein n=1 Tax=Oceanihabitans sp. 2_MG-2023 TaxID=3062661 RepID=UPI0026E2BF68|nr:YhcH/YjgK/YiaL family protein [Oceanihabitans sp. 2_MG-2023]MDO6595888.1 YhcH/YjgK/YiaL family protein [Oceanihabitans sp. 2_MG-2023]
MIFDSLDNAAFYHQLSPHIKKGLEFLVNTKNLQDLPVGRVEIDGDNVFALVQEYDTKAFNVDMWEAHKKYFDIQFIVSGSEAIKVSRIEDMTPNTKYHADGDYWLFSGEGNALKIIENQFAILSPEDIHQPAITLGDTTQKIKKIVVKALI